MKSWKPQLATLTKRPPEGPQWIHEAKLDGYRTLLIKENNQITLLTRNGFDWTKRYPQIAAAAQSWKVKKVVLDGEIVAQNEKGIPDFNKLQNTLMKKDPQGLSFYAFDILSLEGQDVMGRPQLERKKILAALFKKKFSPLILYSEHFTSDESFPLLQQMCQLGLEGIVSKNIHAPYSFGRNENWLKSKCVKSDEFIILGYLTGTHHELGSLLLGSFEKDSLQYIGKVGTGFSKKRKDNLIARFKKLKASRPPVKEKLKYENIVWLKPKLIAEIEYLERTKDGQIRHGSFKTLREDKNVKEVKDSSDHFLFPRVQLKREELHEYYLKIFKLLQPHLKERPLNLYVCHGDISNCYHYRRTEKSKLVNVTLTPKPNGHFIMSFSDVKGLEALLKIGTVEFHTWGTRIEHLERPDIIVFDIDADKEVGLEKIRQCARDIKSLLEELGLRSFIKTSGGKGYHIHVPIQPRYDWNQVKEFALTVSRKLELDHPDLYTSSMSPSKRRNKIFIDHLRNARGSTFVAPYSVRGRPDATLAVPITWQELDKIAPDEFTIKDLNKLLKRKDPWKAMTTLRQRVELLES